MASVTLIPTGATGASNMSISSSYPISNACHNSTNTSSYARYSITASSTGYVYLTFDASGIPSTASIQSVSAKARLRISSTSRVTNRVCQLYTNTTAKGSSVDFSSTSSGGAIVQLSTGTTWTRSELNNLRMRIGGTGSSGNQSRYIYIYGADVTVTYVTESRTVTSTLSGNGTIVPEGATTTYDGEEYELTITPSDTSNPVTVTNNGVDVTDELVAHHSGGTATSSSQAPGSGVTTGFARSNSQFYRGNSSTTGDDWLRYAIGHTAESPYSTSNTSNTYCKDGTNDATTQGWMNYPFDFSALPDDAEITSVEVKCYGATESTTETARHADISLWCGSTQKGTTQSFTSTSNSTITINDPGEWTREELQDAWVRFGVGYYGGRILGITFKVNYTYGGTLHHYTYTYTVDGNATIDVTIGTPGPSTATIYYKNNGSWVAATAVYKKVNGSWVLQSNLSNVFDSNTNYVKG